MFRIKLRWLLFFFFLCVTAVALYGVFTAPAKLEKLSVVVEGKGSWKADISQYVLSYVHMGQDLTPETLAALEKDVESLPWVSKCKLEVKGTTLIIRVWETKPSFILVFGKKNYLIGENGYILGEEERLAGGYPNFFYRGKLSPFIVEGGFLRIRKSVKMEIDLVESRLREINVKGLKPVISLLDSGVQVMFKKPPVLVYLGIDGDSWSEFERLERGKFLKPGVYDFRFAQLLLVKGRQERCLVKKSSL